MSRRTSLSLVATLAMMLTLLFASWAAGQAVAGAATGAPAVQTAAGENPEPAAQTEHVVVYDQKNYWEVHLDVAGTTPYTIGYEYGQAVMTAMPSYARWAWAYLTAADIFFVDYDLCAARAKVLKQNLPNDVQQQIEGMAAGIKKAGGGFWIDKTACYVMTLFPDVGRDTQCSALGAWGTRTPDGRPVVGRILDWTTAILPRINSVTVFHNGDKSFASIGFLGTWSVISGLNKNGVFGAILDAPTGKPYPKRKDLATRRSYPTDLREALESSKTIAEAATYLQAPRDYAFSHQILFGDKTSVAILENDLTGTGPFSRQLRTDGTPLTDGVTWGYKDAVCAVNSFVAQGNECDHFKDAWNKDRWSAYKAQMNTIGAQITTDKMKKMLGYGSAKKGAVPYNDMSVQVMVFEPVTGQLQVGFCGRGEDLPETPDWQTVPIDWNDRVFDAAWTRAWQPEGWQVGDGHIDVSGNGEPCAAVELRQGTAQPTDAAIGVTRYRGNGSLRWRRVLDLPGSQMAILTDMAASRDGGVVVAGIREDGPRSDWLVARYTASGRRAWLRYVSGPGADKDAAGGVVCDAAGNVYVGGSLARRDGAATHLGWCLRKYSAAGRVVWTRVLGSTGGLDDAITGITLGPGGSVVVTGTWAGAAGSRRIAAARFTARGRRLWLTEWTDQALTSPLPTSVAAVRSGIAICGLDADDQGDRALAFTLRPSDGQPVWSYVQPAAVSRDAGFADVAIARNGAVVAVGAIAAASGTGQSYLLSWFGEDGSEQHAEAGGMAGGLSLAQAIAVDGAGNAYVTGTVKATADQPPTMFTQSWGADATLRWLRSYSDPAAPGMDSAGCDLALTGKALYVVGNAGTGMVLVKYNRTTP